MFKLDFVTPESKIVTGQELEEIILPADRGELDILPGHSPLLTTLKPGVLTYKLKSGEKQKYAITWGYCQVSDSGVVVLAENAIHSSEVNAKEAGEELKKREHQLGSEILDDAAWDKVQSEVARLKAELDLTGGARSATH